MTTTDDAPAEPLNEATLGSVINVLEADSDEEGVRALSTDDLERLHKIAEEHGALGTLGCVEGCVEERQLASQARALLLTVDDLRRVAALLDDE